MKTAQLPDNETLRVMALESFGLLDTPPDPVFDNLAQAAASLCEVPIALICLVDPKRQWFKSCVGLDVTETSRDVAFCAHAILKPNSLMEIEDTAHDDRFQDNPLVTGDPGIRFYAGQPLVTSDGFALGTLCVIDRKPRKLTPSQRDALVNLASAVTNLFEERKASPTSAINKVIESTIDSGITISDPTLPGYPITYCNHGFERLTGYGPDDILGKNCRILQGKDTNPAEIKTMRDALGAQRDVTVTLKNYRKDGSAFWNEVVITWIRDDTGVATHILGFQKDVSQQRSAEGRIAGLDAVVDASLNEVYIVDEQTLRFVYVNQRARENLGYTIEELREMTPVDTGAGMKGKTLERVLKPLLDGQRSTLTFETVHKRKDGTVYPVEIQLQLSIFDTRSVLVASVFDLTALKKREEAIAHSRLLLETETALRSSQERYRDLFDNAHDLVQNVLPDGSFDYVNPAWKKTLGFTDSEISNLKVFDIIDPSDHEHCKALFQKILNGENVGEVHVKFVAKSGKTVFATGRVSCNFKDGKPTSTRGIFHDITKHVLAENAFVEARDHAERATATKSRFLAAASHDLRQPLQAIDLYFSAMEDQLKQSDTEDLCGKVRHSLDAVGEILDVLLDVSQLESGSIKPQRENFQVTPALECLVANNQQIALLKGIDLRCEIDPVVIYSDRALLLRILENLVSNAIRYTNHGEIVILCRSEGEVVRIEVQDTGVGMPPETLDSIFEEYYQLDNQSRDHSKGFGLGLTVVKHIAELLKHDISVQSVAGVGSTFSIEVPLGNADEVASQPTAETKPPTKTQKQPIVLFVDDYPEIVNSAARMFKSWGMVTHVAENGDEALEHIRRGISPDIVISDYRLPGINGVELIRQIREMTSPELPAVLLTGDNFLGEIQEASASYTAVLSKPLRPSELRSIIQNVGNG